MEETEEREWAGELGSRKAAQDLDLECDAQNIPI